MSAMKLTFCLAALVFGASASAPAAAVEGGELPAATDVRDAKLHPIKGKDIPIYVIDNFGAGDHMPKLGAGKTADDVTFSVKSSEGFEDWLATLTAEKLPASPKQNLVLLLGSASAYSDESWKAMQTPLLAKFDQLDGKFNKEGWVLVTNGGYKHGHKALGDIALVVAKRGTPVIFVESDYGAAALPGSPDWPTYACAGLFGKGVYHQFAELEDSKTVKGMKPCYGGIVQQGWLGDKYPAEEGMAIKKASEDLAAVARKDVDKSFNAPTPNVKAEGVASTTEGIVKEADGTPKYAFPDKAVLVGFDVPDVPTKFLPLLPKLREVLVVGGGFIPKQQITMYPTYVSLLIKTTPPKEGTPEFGAGLPATATKCTCTTAECDAECIVPEWTPPASAAPAMMRFRGGAKV